MTTQWRRWATTVAMLALVGIAGCGSCSKVDQQPQLKLDPMPARSRKDTTSSRRCTR